VLYVNHCSQPAHSCDAFFLFNVYMFVLSFVCWLIGFILSFYIFDIVGRWFDIEYTTLHFIIILHIRDRTYALNQLVTNNILSIRNLLSV
jgi:hypothetical protein